MDHIARLQDACRFLALESKASLRAEYATRGDRRKSSSCTSLCLVAPSTKSAKDIGPADQYGGLEDARNGFLEAQINDLTQ